MQGKTKFVLIIAVVVVALLIFSNNPTFNPLANDYGTGRVINTTSTRATISADSDSGIVKGTFLTVTNTENYVDPTIERETGELLDSDRYVVSWAPGERSKAITAKCDMTFLTKYEYVWSYLKECPTTVVGDYYWQVTYTDLAGKKTVIIDGKNFTGGAADTSIKTDYVYLVRGYPRRNFPNLVSSGLDFTYVDSGKKITLYTWAKTFTGVLETDTLVFEMKGNRIGSLNIKCMLGAYAYAHHDDWIGPIPTNRVYATYTPPPEIVLSEDNCYLASGRGEVRIESTNAISNEGGAKADGTGITYTKYVYEEGSTVTFGIDTGYSGTSLNPDQDGYSEGWRLDIVNDKGLTVKTQKLADGLKNYKYSFTIPTGSFSCGSSNEWMVTLSNTLFDQSEARIFVVDSFAKIPGKTTAKPNKNQYNQWDIVTITLSATSNSAGGDIKQFRVWATYDSATSTNYAMTARNIPATKSGTTFTATVTFQVIKGDKNVYFTAVAQNVCNRAGPEGECTVYVKQVIPTPPDWIDFITTAASDYGWLIVLLVAISVGGVGLYIYQKRKGIKLPSLKRRKK